MKKLRSIHLPKELNDAFKDLPISKSAATSLAIMQAHANTEVLVRAFRLRLSSPSLENDIKTSFNLDLRVEQLLSKLADMTKLPLEQVVRLCMEAYIHKL